MRYRYDTKPKSPIKKEFKQSVAVPLRDNNRADKIDEINLGGNMSPTYKTSGFEIFYTLIKDIRDIRDDLERIKKVIKIPEGNNMGVQER